MLHTLLIAAAIVGGIAIITGILIYYSRHQRRQSNMRLHGLYQSLLARHKLQPDFAQTFDHRILGLDTTGLMFVFAQQNEELPSAVIDLTEVRDCRLWKDGVQISRKRAKGTEMVEEYISSIGLSFVRKSGVVVTVPIYTEVLDGIEEKIALSKAADQWLHRLKSVLASLPQQHSQPAHQATASIDKHQ